ncbi:apicoplast import protein [Cystoisospora suis]|uniref:Apicoplast import protein n=1 Tax=Cystoisospora suis TaxID=483139 RepID=A0A2C6KKT7_9APIC|nr:apicoplast import protein [Cystoisospora suis]
MPRPQPVRQDARGGCAVPYVKESSRQLRDPVPSRSMQTVGELQAHRATANALRSSEGTARLRQLCRVLTFVLCFFTVRVLPSLSLSEATATLSSNCLLPPPRTRPLAPHNVELVFCFTAVKQRLKPRFPASQRARQKLAFLLAPSMRSNWPARCLYSRRVRASSAAYESACRTRSAFCKLPNVTVGQPIPPSPAPGCEHLTTWIGLRQKNGRLFSRLPAFARRPGKGVCGDPSDGTPLHPAENSGSRLKMPSLLHRIAAAGVYMLPNLELLQTFLPALQTTLPSAARLWSILGRCLSVYGSIPCSSLLTFAGPYTLLIKNKGLLRPSYFLRHHTMTALMISMLQYTVSMIYFKGISSSLSEAAPVHETTVLSLYLTVQLLLLSSAFRALKARYGWIPVITEAVALHIGDKPPGEY